MAQEHWGSSGFANTDLNVQLQQAGIEIESADVTQRPKSRVPVSEDDAGKLMKLIDALEESDDVGAVHANYDVDAEVLERIAG